MKQAPLWWNMRALLMLNSDSSTFLMAAGSHEKTLVLVNILSEGLTSIYFIIRIIASSFRYNEMAIILMIKYMRC